MNTIPKRVLKSAGVKTSREFKQLKRKQVRDLEKLAHDLMVGLAYSPAGLDIVRTCDKILIVKDKLSLEKWGR